MDEPHTGSVVPQEGEAGTAPGAGTPPDAASHASDPQRQPARRGLPLPPLRLLGLRVLIGCFLILVLFADVIAGWPIVQPSTAFALAFKNPDPALSTPSWLTQTTSPGKKPNLNQSASSSTTAPASTAVVQNSTSHQWHVPMRPARLTLTTAAQHFVSSDGQLLVDIPAGSLDTTQSKGGVTLVVTQVKPASGSTDSGGSISLGTYEFQFFNGAGKPLTTLHLHHPFTVHLHVPADQELIWKGQKVNAIWSAVQGDASLPAVPAQSLAIPATGFTSVEPHPLTTQKAVLSSAHLDKSGRDWSIQTSFTASTTSTSQTSKTAAVQTVQPAVVQASTVAYNTTAPQATWGTPTMPQVGLNSGGLNYSYPLSIPPGPGGFQPNLALNYSSGSVDENHGWQSAAPWVGEGWSLDLGSISWAQENVTPNQSAELENVWHINDPSGIGGQLIPPDRTYTTSYPVVPSTSSWPNPAPIWHTAPESHAKVQEILFGGYPCWRVYLPNGVMEEFGCTDPSREAYPDSQGRMVAYSWKLDMMVDRYGNQVHINYQRIYPASKGQVEDAVISDIEYDDPTCHSTSTMCGNGTGSWNPLVKIVFDANQTVAHLLNGGCGSGTAGVSRCDDPGSSTLPAPEVMSAYVLNDVKVQVQGNLLREYVFSYNQGGASTATDPNTGESEGIAGYLTLGKIQEEGTNGTTLNAPVVTIQYAQEWEHYADLFSYSNNGNGNVCSPYSAAPRDGSSTGPCFLWSQSMNAYYISNLDNGEGWNESVSWKEAHSNTWGTDGGTNYNNAFQCSSSQTSTNICGTADDKNWSRVVVASRTATSNGVSSTWSYSYYLSAVSAAIPGQAVSARYKCGSGKPDGLCESYDWGDQNDDDYADYYNGSFESFAQTQVTMPDGSSQTDSYGATNGWGLYSSSIVSGNCALPPCYVAAFNASNGPVLAGDQTQEQDYNSSGQLMQQTNWTWSTNCPPQGVPGSANALGGSSDPGGSQLFSELDHSNPVLVCDPRATKEDIYLTDGVTSNLSDPRVIHTTITATYDGNTCGSQGYDYGNKTKRDVTANDVGGAHVVSTTLFCPNDNISGGTYLTDLPAQTQTLDGSGTQYGCAQTYYGGNSSALSPPTLPDVTRTDVYTAYTGGCTGNVITTRHTYDASGNSITGTDPDGHLGCTNGSTQYTACATYDSSDTHLLAATNAKNQGTTYEYDQDAAEAGFGQWLMAETDPNGQTTTYEYDALGRLKAVIEPGDSLSSPTTTYTYINTCSPGKTTPCLEIDTAARSTAGGPMSVEKTWYDGAGHQVETQVPGPNLFSRVPAIGSVIVSYTIYDKMGNATITSVPYAVAATAGLGYVAPDLNQARTVTSYDSLGRSLGSVAYGTGSTIVSESSTSYTVAQGVSTLSGESNNAYEQAITLDAYHHQSITYTDGFGQARYGQVFSGTSNPYTVVRTVGTTYDTAGNTLTVTTYDSSGTIQATSSATYDGLGQVMGANDSDQGSCQNIPMPTDCSSPSDTAWKYTYDADGNLLSETDPRNISTYTSYDVLDRPLCQALTAADASSCGGTTDAISFYDGYSNASTPGATFPSGCTAPSGSYASNPVGQATAEIFIGANGAGSGWRCAGYDQRERMDQDTLSVTTPDGHTVTQTVNMSYNDQNDVTSLVYPDGEVLTSTYDGNGRFQSAYFGSSSTPDPVNFLVGKTTYTNYGAVATLALGGTGAKTSTPTALFTLTMSYDNIQRPLGISATEGGTTFYSQTRTYDNLGNVLGVSTTVPTQSGGMVSENEAFCYDALSRLVWAGNSGTPTGGDHCMSLPSANGISAYSQAYTYDNLDRITSGSAGTYTYGDPTHPHAVTGVSSVPNQYATYDAMGNMTCRNTDTTSGHACAGSSPTGATMTYDSQGELSSWTAPSGTSTTETYLYDNQGNRVLTTSSTNGTPTDTIDFDGLTQTIITGSTTTTKKFYTVGGQTIAEKVGSTLYYLLPDMLGSVALALTASGSVTAVSLYNAYGQKGYAWGSMPTNQGYTGQQLDSQSGLVYYNARWYDPLTGRFTTADTAQNNTSGMDPYAYVQDSPETMMDPTGHDSCDVTCWFWGIVNDPASYGPVNWQGMAEVVLYSTLALLFPEGDIGLLEDLEMGGDTSEMELLADIASVGASYVDTEAYGVAGADVQYIATEAGVAQGAANDIYNEEEMIAWYEYCVESDKADIYQLIAEGYPNLAEEQEAALIDDYQKIRSYEQALAQARKQEDIANQAITDAVNEADQPFESGGGESLQGGGDSAGGGGCDDLSFRANTPVATANGEQEISTLQVGEQVWAYNPQTKQMELQTIQKVWLNHDNDLVDVTLVTTVKGSDGKTKEQKEVIHTNEKHPFLTKEKGFIPVSQLKPGMHVLEANGSYGVVGALVIVPGAMWMYNLTVAQDHTYTVGLDQWVVHNCADTLKPKAWIQHDTYNEIRNKFGEDGVQKFVNAMNKGFVGPQGENGIKALTGKGVSGFSYEIKVKGWLGDWRVFGNYDEDTGFYIFSLFGKGAH